MSPLLLMVISNVLNVAVLVFLLWKFALPRLGAMIASKQEAISLAIDEAEKNLADVDAELAAVRKELQQTEVQIEQIRSESASRGVAAAEKIKADTEIELQQMQQRIERQIEQEFSNLRIRLRQDLVNQVILKAEAMVRERAESDKELQTQLVENFAYSLQNFKEFKS